MFEFSVACPICTGAKAFRRLEDYNSRVVYNCQRCGRFRIGKVAYSDLESRFPRNINGLLPRMKLRQFIKRRQAEEEWPQVTVEDIIAIANDPSLPMRRRETQAA